MATSGRFQLFFVFSFTIGSRPAADCAQRTVNTGLAFPLSRRVVGCESVGAWLGNDDDIPLQTSDDRLQWAVSH